MNMRVENAGLQLLMTSGHRLDNIEYSQEIQRSESAISGQEIMMFKQLLAELAKPATSETLDKVSQIISQADVLQAKGHFEKNNVLALLEKWHIDAGPTQVPAGDVSQLIDKTSQQVDENATALSNIRREMLKDRAEINFSQSQFMAAKAISHQAATENKITTGTSYAKLWEIMALAIKNIKTDYVDFYANLMQKYTVMFESFNETLQKASSLAVTAGDDGNNVRFSADTMKTATKQFENALSKIDLGTVKNWKTMSDADKASMSLTLEPAFFVDYSGNIRFDLKQYNSIYGIVPAGMNGGKVSTASYQAWLATFNACSSAFQSNMQAFAQRYSQSNSTFDNLNKVLSGSISAMADSAKDVLKSLN